MYEKSCDIIYAMISERVRTRRNVLRKKNNEIHPELDGCIISAIANNRRHPKKNTYLIPSGSCEKPVVETISANLGFDSPIKLLIGSQIEVEAYSGYLFHSLLIDAYESESSDIVERINSVLSDYIPYSISCAYMNAKNTYGDIIDALLGTQNSNKIIEYTVARDYAIARTFRTVKDEYIVKFSSLFIESPDTLKLNKRLSDFTRNTLLPLLERNRHGNPFEPKVYLKLSDAFKRLAYYELYEERLSPETIGFHENEKTNYERTHFHKWFQALFRYINVLSKIQNDAEGKPFIKSLENQWEIEMFI